MVQRLEVQGLAFSVLGYHFVVGFYCFLFDVTLKTLISQFYMKLHIICLTQRRNARKGKILKHK
jgi:hypothetical protein